MTLARFTELAARSINMMVAAGPTIFDPGYGKADDVTGAGLDRGRLWLSLSRDGFVSRAYVDVRGGGVVVNSRSEFFFDFGRVANGASPDPRKPVRPELDAGANWARCRKCGRGAGRIADVRHAKSCDWRSQNA